MFFTTGELKNKMNIRILPNKELKGVISGS